MPEVLVTGAGGHVGYNLVALLRERGYAVRAGLRDPAADPVRAERLRALGAELVPCELLKPETLRAACAGVEGVFQVAAVYQTYAKDPEREIIRPTVEGARNVLDAAREAGVRKIVFTSSIAAVGSAAPPEKPLTEDDWNDAAPSPYFQAKVRSEREAWAYAKAHGLKLVSINPGAIIGPGFWRHTPSTLSFELLIRRKLPAIFPTGFTLVDVRDVAMAHLLAYENVRASGRYLAVDRFCTMRELLEACKTVCPELRPPKRVIPASLLPAVAALDCLGHALAGMPRQVTMAMIRELGGKYQRASGARLREELGWSPMPFETSLRDTLDWIKKRVRGTLKRNAAFAVTSQGSSPCLRASVVGKGNG
ncbi:MAG: NAD-dependent epimerase/dehydratase family protein [Planctomycetota bacterium]|nr:NAD-dependent epimerase/dehydratase family protein [Planctomycetota bacterium]